MEKTMREIVTGRRDRLLLLEREDGEWLRVYIKQINN